MSFAGGPLVRQASLEDLRSRHEQVGTFRSVEGRRVLDGWQPSTGR